jgi:hypothetical protein
MFRQSVLKRNKDPDNWIIYVEELGITLEDMGSTMIDDHPHSCFKQPYKWIWASNGFIGEKNRKQSKSAWNQWNPQRIESTLWKIERERVQQRQWWCRWSSPLYNLKENDATVGSLVIKKFNALSGENKKGREMMVYPLLVIIVRSLIIPMLIVFNFLGEIKMVKVTQVLQDKGLRDHHLM